MCEETVNLNTRAKAYPPFPQSDTNGGSKGKSPMDENSCVPPPIGPLQIEKPIFDTILHPPKATIRKAVFNPNARAAQNYNIAEDLAQAVNPQSSSTFPYETKNFVVALGAIKLEHSNHLVFNLENFKTQLSH